MIAPNKIDIFTSTGVQALRQLIMYQYDIDVDFTATRITKKVEASLADGTVADDPWAVVEVDAVPGKGYYGRTIFKYRTLSLHLLGMDTFRFTLEIPTLPVKLNDVIDAMLTKYGIIVEVADFGDTDTTVLAPAYGDYTLTTADTSLRFNGDWFFSFVAPGTVDLDASVPNSQDAAMSSVADGQAPE